MIEISHKTPLRKLNSISIGDRIIDDYESQGAVVKIAKNVKFEYVEFKFILDNRQTIFILSSL